MNIEIDELIEKIVCISGIIFIISVFVMVITGLIFVILLVWDFNLDFYYIASMWIVRFFIPSLLISGVILISCLFYWLITD